MKAVVNEKFGPPEVMQMKEMDKPEISEEEILVKTYATSVNTIDIVFRSGLKAIFGLARLSTGIRGPKKSILGFDFSGEIVEVGSMVSEFQVGDRVFGGSISGANAEYMRTKPTRIANIPDNINFDEAAGIPMAGLTALQALRDSGKIKQGQKVLIYGASGGIGTMAVQLAKYFDTTVTGVASGRNREIVLSLGADDFVDYTQDNFIEKLDKYDLIIDAVGKFPHSEWKKPLKKGGIFVNIGSPSMSITRVLLAQMGNRFRKEKYESVGTAYEKSDLELLAELYSNNKIKTIIEATYPLEQLAEAHHHYEKGRTVGKIIVSIRDDNDRN